jgi:hypothetical protein
VEDAFHLLRRAPISTLAVYAAGAIPYMIGLLAFTADMTQSPFADERLAGEALGLAILFLWLKVWQSEFGRRLRSLAAGEEPPRWSLRQAGHDLFVAGTLAPSGLFAIPAAFAVTLPFGWVFAFYQNATVDAGEAGKGLRNAWRLSARRARLRPRQNHAALLVLLLLAVFVFANVTVALAMLPYLARSLFGFESTFTRSGLAAINSTFFAVAFAIAWACLDPLIKAVYVLRCFEADAIETGDDLKADWRAAFQPEKLLAMLLLVAVVPAGLGACPSNQPTGAADVASPSRVQSSKSKGALAPRESISPGELDRAIARVLEKSDYAWRSRRPRTEQPKGGLSGFFESIGNFFEGVYRKARQAWRTLQDWLQRLVRPQGDDSERTGGGTAWIVSTNALLLLLIAALASTIVVLLLRRRRRGRRAEATSLVLPAQPEPADDASAAAALPEGEWRARAATLAASGEFRQAARALYLCNLAFLADREAITLARSKSNREYARELERRLRGRPDLPVLFAENMLVFERVWYGRHPAGAETLVWLGGNLDRLKAEMSG